MVALLSSGAHCLESRVCAIALMHRANHPVEILPLWMGSCCGIFIFQPFCVAGVIYDGALINTAWRSLRPATAPPRWPRSCTNCRTSTSSCARSTPPSTLTTRPTSRWVIRFYFTQLCMYFSMLCQGSLIIAFVWNFEWLKVVIEYCKLSQLPKFKW